jgi:hypothetical protein
VVFGYPVNLQDGDVTFLENMPILSKALAESRWFNCIPKAGSDYAQLAEKKR